MHGHVIFKDAKNLCLSTLSPASGKAGVETRSTEAPATEDEDDDEDEEAASSSCELNAGDGGKEAASIR